MEESFFFLPAMEKVSNLLMKLQWGLILQDVKYPQSLYLQ